MGQRADEVSNLRRQDDRDLGSDLFISRETEIVSSSDDQGETEEIRAEIEQTRADMSETIEAIQERLSPSHLKEQAQEQFQDIKEQVREQVREQFQEAKHMVREATIGRVEHMVQYAGETVDDVQYTITDTIKQNPIPATLVGIGLGWLFMNRSATKSTRFSGRGGVRGSQIYSGRGYSERSSTLHQAQEAAGNTASSVWETAGSAASSVRDSAGAVASNVSETAGNVVNQVQETAGNVANQVQESASQLVDQAQYRTERIEERFQQMLYERPLAVGAITLALGTAVGLAVPETCKEHELMGEARDNLLEKAQGVASDTMEKVQRVAGEAVDEAKSTAKVAAQQQGLTS
ncbi:MAG: hypothetical protein CYG59_18050 [Chloroflexi bacterium]|nr:MAG: hypothetical protein CYG59_18050 [Chloroflexota bacterium]